MALPKSHIAILSLRGISLLFLLLSFVILLNNGNTHKVNGKDYLIWKKIESYSYMFGATIIGIGYTVLQTIVFVIFQIMRKSDKYVLFEFYGDKVISYLLLSAAAAGIGASRDIKAQLDAINDHFNEYLNKGFAAANLLLPAFVCTAILSILSSYALPKKV